MPTYRSKGRCPPYDNATQKHIRRWNSLRTGGHCPHQSTAHFNWELLKAAKAGNNVAIGRFFSENPSAEVNAKRYPEYGILARTAFTEYQS